MNARNAVTRFRTPLPMVAKSTVEMRRVEKAIMVHTEPMLWATAVVEAAFAGKI